MSAEDELQRALRLWRQTRAQSLAEFIDRCTTEVIANAKPPRLKRDFQAAWLKAVNDDTARGWALATLADKLPGPDLGGAGLSDEVCEAMLARLKAIAFVDPRAGQAVWHWLETRSYKWAVFGDEPQPLTRAIDAECERILAESVDERLVAQLTAKLEAIAQNPYFTDAERERERRWVASLKAAYAPTRALTPDELAFATSRTAPKAPRRAFSNDAAAVAVLVDELLAEQDPRGEFMALQLARADVRRSETLLKRFGHLWVGAAAPALARVHFERGVMTRAELREDVPLETLTAPEWSTLEELHSGEASAADYARVLALAALPGLRRVETGCDVVITALERRGVPVDYAALSFELDSQLPVALHRLKALNVRHLGLPDDPLLLEATLAHPIAAQLGELTIVGVVKSWVDLLKQVGAKRTVTLRKNAYFDHLRAKNDAWAGRIVVTQNEGVDVTVRGQWALYDCLEAKWPRVRRVTVLGATKPQRALFEEQFPHAELVFQADPAPTGVYVFKP